MTPEELAAIRARAEAATPGPWKVDEGPALADPLLEGEGDWYRHIEGWTNTGWEWLCLSPEDAAFIAHAREDIPKLLDEVEALRARAERAEEQVRLLTLEVDVEREAARAARKREQARARDARQLRQQIAELEVWSKLVLSDAQAAWRRYHAVRVAADGLREELERLVLSHHATLEEGLQCDRCEDAVNEIVDYDALNELAADAPDAQIRLVVDAARRFVQALDATEASVRPDPEGVIDGPHGQALRAAVAALDAARGKERLGDEGR